MRNRLAVAVLSAVTIGAVLTSGAPASAATPLPDAPCTLQIPAKVDVASPVTAKIGECPAGALADSIYWRLEGPSGPVLGFSYDGDGLYPTRGLTDTYGTFYPGIYRISPTASDTFCEDDYSACYEIPLYANTVVSKYRTATALQITRSSSKGKWTTKVSAQVRRYERYSTSAVANATVQVYRDGRLFKTLKTNAAGSTGAVVADTKGTHSYKAVVVEGSATWSSTSTGVKR